MLHHFDILTTDQIVFGELKKYVSDNLNLCLFKCNQYLMKKVTFVYKQSVKYLWNGNFRQKAVGGNAFYSFICDTVRCKKRNNI